MAGAGMKGLAKDTAIYGLSSIVGRFLNWLLVPLYTNIFTDTGEYGIVTNIYGYVAFAVVILTFGMETTFFRFINKNEERASTVYSTTLITLASTSLLFLFICFSFINPISSWMKYPDHSDYILIMAATVAIDAFCSIPFAYLRYKKKPIRFASLKLLMIFLNIALNIFFLLVCPKIYASNPDLISWFYNPSYGIGYIFAANLITSLGTLLLLIPDLTGFKYKLDFPLLKSMLKYTFPLLILGIAGVMNQTADKILYPFLFSDEKEALRQLGIYGACAKIAVVMTMFTQAFRYAYEPFIFAQNKGKDNKLSYVMAMKYFVIFGLFIFLAVMFYLDIIKYFVGKSYFEGLNVVSIVMMGEIFFGIYFNLSLWYKLIDKTHYGAIFSILGCAVIVAINIIFVPRYGYIASAWASFFGNLVMMLISYFFGQKYYPIAYKIKNMLFYLILASLLFAIAWLVEIDADWLKFSFRTLLLAIYVYIVVKKDLPLSEFPGIGRFVKKK
ncbi:lipopolysaccharide biosynthesis protein [Dysgonomonas sp. 520]|uniref:lipopolysaccharide biosynthesis protein n=1 Tax=Dysgonomonas sp. 520 TaxID=2302931 RepID=UPI0013D78507|nr:polysaccharide biosynthesis C-terminal domain-containing protein [Dysgonomonas sp. 520]NDW09976.1 lipopolysaccharide biosynthesis protein [Dysgonomonas sp. 520]